MTGLLETLNAYLPIADITINVVVVCCAAIFSGMLSGMFGVGGGLSLIPILTLIGVDPVLATTSNTNQTIASALSGYIAYARRKRVDYPLALVLMLGGLLGAFFGVRIIAVLKSKGLLDLVMSLSFLLLLGVVGLTTMVNAIGILYRNIRNIEHHYRPRFIKTPSFLRLPLQVKFPSAHQEMSLFAPMLLGIIGGISTSFLGVGAGFVMIPVMVYLLGISEAFTAGTTQFQTIFTTIFATILYCYNGRYFDIVLSSILMVASAVGVQLGVRISSGFHPGNFRMLLALVILVLCMRMFWQCTSTPDSMFVLEPLTLLPTE